MSRSSTSTSRVWTGPLTSEDDTGEERTGETVEGRDEEISILIDSGLHKGWDYAEVHPCDRMEVPPAIWD